MCLICVEFQKEKMTIQDARRALGEMVETLEPDHAEEVDEMLDEAELEQQRDEEEDDD
ncbi:MAG: hypothetical protein ACOC9W_00030 [Persicimonas sp.]